MFRTADPRMKGVQGRGTMTLLLVCVALFVTAQLAWWLYFQNAYVERVSRETLSSWNRDAQALQSLISLGGDAETLGAAYPHLVVSGQRVMVDPVAEETFRQRQERRLRMFAFECAGFVALMLVAFALMGKRLRVERELKLQQQNFLSAVSHELKTPMSSMRLLVETALYRPLAQPKQRDYLQRMEGELARLEQLAETVLASTRLEAADSAALTLEPMDLQALVREYLDSHRLSFEARGAEITLEAPPEKLSVSLDRSAFKLIMTNLLDNAIKYTPGQVTPILITLEGRGHLVRLHVTDKGLGIPASAGQRVFDRFYRVGSEMVRTAPGVGLGLHLVRLNTEAMNGWVRHQPGPGGTGTRFTLSFPRSLQQTGAPGGER